eukprot:scaffold17117_cov52-Attheya_sp.AAC.2
MSTSIHIQESIMQDEPSVVQQEISSSAAAAQHDVPLVQLELQNVTYAPVTKQVSSVNVNATGNATGNININININKKHQLSSRRRTVLKNVSTTILPYQLSAWMGPSGSGKTSLISVAAGLTHAGDLMDGSRVLVNGEEGRLPKRLVGVVWQDDLLLSNLTVEETIYFCARLKTPLTVSDALVRTTVQETMEELGILKLAHSLVGGPGGGGGRGISGGERKRVAVASELVVRPSLLFLDEPTSGLDATTARSLMQTLQDLAVHGGHSIAVVIHQPRTEIYHLLHHLLLLSQGQVIFDGKPSDARTYLEALPTVRPLPPETGIADWLMDTTKEDELRSEGAVLASHWKERQQTGNNVEEETKFTNETIASASVSTSASTATLKATATRQQQRVVGVIVPQRRHMSSLHELHSSPKFVTGFGTQLKLLTLRSLKQQRGEKLTRTAIFLTAAYVFFTCLFWWRMPNTTAWIFERNSLLFFILISQANGIVVTSITVFQRERALLRRERAIKLYGVLPFFIAKTASDMTNNVLLPCCYAGIIYYAAGLRPEFTYFLKYLLNFYLTMSAAQSMGLFLSVIIPSMQIALILAPPITLFFIILGGFYVPFDSMNAGVQWMSWLSFARYGYSSMLVNEFAGRYIPCADTEDIAVSIGISGECPLPGDDVIASLAIEGVSANFWFGIGMMSLLQIFFRVLSYAFLRRSK